MKSDLLIPYHPSLKPIGFLIACPGIILGYFYKYQYFAFSCLSYGNGSLFGGNENFTDEIATTLIVVGLFFIVFTRAKNEGPNATYRRLNALYWSVLAASSLFMACVLISVFIDLAFSFLLYFFIYLFAIFIFISNYHLFFARALQLQTSPPIGHKYHQTAGKFTFALCLLTITVNLFTAIFPSDLVSIACFFLMLGLWIWCASKEEIENKSMINLRHQSVQIAVYLGSISFLVVTWTIYGPEYLIFLLAYPAIILTLFMMIFQFKKHRSLTSEVGL